MHIDAGALSKRITFVRRAPTVDADGYASDTDEEIVRECWAKFSQTSGTELIRAGAEMGEVKVRFLVRYHPVITDRRLVIRYAGGDYDIVYVNTYGDKGDYMEFWCERRTMEGQI